MILDIFSRYVVGWMIAPRECAELAEQLIADTVRASTTSSPARSPCTPTAAPPCAPSRWPACWSIWTSPRATAGPTSRDDNPYSEAQFKTLKYRPDFPARFGCIEDARAHCQAFFAWYNDQHRHSGIGYMTPHSVHYGQAAGLRAYASGHAGCRIPGHTRTDSRAAPSTAAAAHRGLDQPTT